MDDRDNKIKVYLSELSDLAADPGRIAELESNVWAINDKLSETRSKLTVLKSGSKGYDAELGRLASVASALETQLVGALDELEAECKRCRLAACDKQTKTGALGDSIKALDVEILNKLAGVWDLLIKRSDLSAELGRTAAVLCNINAEYHLPPVNFPNALPWGQAASTGPSIQAFDYISRFATMRKLLGPPGDGQDLLSWFSRRRF